ncbi:MAG: reverse transcriptase family protein [Pseudorhodobacter sp.]
MQIIDVLRPLSATLAQQVWTLEALKDHLNQRLPGRYRYQAPKIALALVQAFPTGTAPDAKQITQTLLSLPQARTLWAFAKTQGQRPKNDLTSPSFLPHPALENLPIPALSSQAELADWLAISPDMLLRFADLRGLSAHSPDRFGPHYHHHLIPKRNGQLRLIEEPKPFLKHLQRRLLQGLLSHVPPHDAAFGFRTGRNCVTAAARHSNEAVVISFDLAHFFPSIGFTRLYSLFRSLGYPAAVARDLTGLCTSLLPKALHHHPNLAAHDLLTNRHLPQGAPSSPALANLAAFALDCRLSGLARSLGATYTRYADDLSFSGDAPIAGVLQRAVPQIVADAGFTLNPAKTRQAFAHQQQCITGIIVNQSLNLPRDTYDHLKAVLHHLSKPDDPRRNDPGFLAQLSGRIAWAEQINPTRGAKLRARYDRLHSAHR